MPGEVIKGHAKEEENCEKCHKKFDKAAQSGLCADCHKEIGKDLAEKKGYHGRLDAGKECKECHTDHKGRDAKIAEFDHAKFDHNQTDYPLKGGHLKEKVKCTDCHKADKKYRDAPSYCNECHKKDDKHKGGLGTDCAKCHVEKDWKTTVQSRQDQVQAAGQARRREMRQVPHRQQVQGHAHAVQLMSQEGRQAQGQAWAEMRVVPHRKELEGNPVRSRQEDQVSAAGQAQGSEVRQVSHRQQVQGHAQAVQCLPQEGRRQGAQGQVRDRSARPATPRRTGRKSFSITTRPSIRCWASTRKPSA